MSTMGREADAAARATKHKARVMGYLDGGVIIQQDFQTIYLSPWEIERVANELLRLKRSAA
jgi:hypothetical protein